ncbi:MAG: YIP1 family protein [Desulfatiglandales bacterium]|nr:YIP1 family protein [Desulfatiglandales bacterium]
MTVKITCPYCNFSKQMSMGKIPPGTRWATCPRCKQRFEFVFQDSVGGIQEVPTGKGAGSKRGASPWERRSEQGVWRGLCESFKGVLFSPEKIFSTMTHKGGIKEPLAFGLLLGSLGAMIGFFWDFLMIGDRLITKWPTVIGQFNLGVIFLIVMILTPFFVMMSMFVVSGILHLCLLIAGGGRNGFEGTFRVVAFSQSTKILELVPFIGRFIGWLWHFIVQVIGLREMHETSYLRTIIAMILPIVLIFIISMAIIVPLFIFLRA